MRQIDQTNLAFCKPSVKALFQLVSIICPEFKVTLYSIGQVSWVSWHLWTHIDRVISCVLTD